METRSEFLQGGSAAAVAAFAGQAVILAEEQRADALSIVGNRILHTPNLDRIAQEGAYVRNPFVG